MKDVEKIIAKIPNGRFFKLTYMTELPINKIAEVDGIERIYKMVTLTTRTGVRYSNIAKVAAQPRKEKKSTTSNWSWIIPNKIKHNSNTGKDYLVIAPIKNASEKVQYLIFDSESKLPYYSDENFEIKKDWLNEGYLAKHAAGKTETIKTILLDNVINIKI